MRSVPLALTWELLQRGKWSLPGAFLAANAMPLFLFIALRMDGGLDPEEQSSVTIHVMMTLICAMTFGVPLINTLGSPSRLYAFPVTASAIVAGSLIPSVTLMVLAYLVSAAGFNFLFQLNWPLCGPAMFLAVGLVAIAAVFFVAEKSPWHMLLLGIPAAILGGLWFYSRYGLLPGSGPVRMWPEVTPTEVLTHLVMAAAAYWAAVWGVTRNRCGEYLQTPRFFHWLKNLFDPAPAVGLPFRTPAQAQFWFEWRQKGWALPGAVAIVLPIVFCGWLIGSRVPQDLFEAVLFGGMFLAMAALIVGFMMGNAGLEMGHFGATRPMATADMSRTMLKTAGMSLLVAWGLWLAALLTLYAILLAVGVQPALPKALRWWYLPATLLGAWLSMGVLATLAQAGRQTLSMVVITGSIALAIAWLLFSKFALSHDQEFELQFRSGTLIVLAVAFVLSTIWAFVAARRRGLIGTPTVSVAAGLWTALSALVAVEFILRPQGPLPLYLFVIGLLALAAFPLAGAPLALAWNRTR